mgnify:CR=1 FL=1
MAKSCKHERLGAIEDGWICRACGLRWRRIYTMIGLVWEPVER